MQVQEFDLAIAQFDLVLRKLPDFARAFYGRGKAFLGDERYDLALEDFDKAIELEPDFPGTYVERGKVYKERGNLEAAIADWETVIELADPVRHLEEIFEAVQLMESIKP